MRSLHALRSLRSLHTCKTSIHQTRQFHPTRPAPFINEVLDVASNFIQGVHSFTGLPWIASIPLTALIVRTTVAMPLQMYTKVQARKEQTLAPVLMSWRHHYEKEIRDMRQRIGGGSVLLPAQASRILSKDLKTKQRSLHRHWGVHRFWKPANFLQLPVWISVMESLRAMSGNNRGLVPYLLSLMEPESSGSSLHLAVEPSLANEGAFWFPDLLAGDPTGILPILLTASIIINVRNGWKTPAMKDLAYMPKPEMLRRGSGKLLKGFIQILALNIGVASFAYEMPTALLVYWITSTNMATAQSFVLDKFMFARPALKPWKKIYLGLPQQGKVMPVSKNL